MSLQRRLLLYLLVCAPLVWAAAFAVSVNRARHEVNEMFDTQLVRLARQVHALSPVHAGGPVGEPPPQPVIGGDADLGDLAIAVWDGHGRAVMADRAGAQLPWRKDVIGFEDVEMNGSRWRIYYLPSPDGSRVVAAGQTLHERNEVVWGLVGGGLLPWLLVLPVLLVVMAWAVRTALAPVRQLAAGLSHRQADDLHTVPLSDAPLELHPMIQAMNGLFGRIGDTLARERRFTADAAHELRTPISVLAAQWDVYRRARDEHERQRAGQALDKGLQRMARLIDQLLRLSRLDATERLKDPQPLDWDALIEQVMSDVLPLAERRRIELACERGDAGDAAPPWRGDPHLMALLLRNLLDNAVRYAPEGSTVTLRLAADEVQVDNPAPPDLRPEDMAAWGERFHRLDGQPESGSGLGVSIAQRIAELHGLALQYRHSADVGQVIATLHPTR